MANNHPTGQNLLNRTISAFGIVLTLTGCEPSDTDSLRQENKILKIQVQALEEQVTEKDRQILTLRSPDKAQFDDIDAEWIRLGGVFIWTKDPPIATDVLSALLQKYFDFQVAYPNSPLAANARDRIESLKKEIARQAAIEEKEKRFLSTPAVSVEDISEYPERYLGKSVKVSGSVKRSLSGYEIAGLRIRTGLNQDEAFLDHITQGKPAGVYTTLIVTISRDENLKVFADLIEIR
jgi:hypothetical protein